MTHRILLIANDPEIIDALTPYLVRTMGYEVTAAVDGESALDEACRQAFDLCIMDLCLPGITSAETYRRLKSLLPELEVIFFNDPSEEPTSDFLHFSLPPERLIPNPLDDVARLTCLIIGILGPPVP